MIGDAIGVGATYPANLGERGRATTASAVIGRLIGEVHTECDTVDAGILATNGLGAIKKPFDARRPDMTGWSPSTQDYHTHPGSTKRNSRRMT
jgi:hypothetical protein